MDCTLIFIDCSPSEPVEDTPELCQVMEIAEFHCSTGHFTPIHKRSISNTRTLTIIHSINPFINPFIILNLQSWTHHEPTMNPTRNSSHLPQELPHLRQWRREGKAVEVRMLRATRHGSLHGDRAGHGDGGFHGDMLRLWNWYDLVLWPYDLVYLVYFEMIDWSIIILGFGII